VKELKISNASHEPIIGLPLIKEEIKKRDVQFFHEVHGPRLGQDEGAVYQQSVIKIGSPHRLLLYSDGIFEMDSENGNQLSERLWLMAITKAYTPNVNLNNYFESLMRYLALPQSKPLKDDVSIVAVELNT